MRTGKIIIVILLLIAIGVAAYFARPQVPDVTYPKLETGDIVFRRENSFWGDIATSVSRRDGTYSHSGIIIMQNGKPFVIHAFADTDKKEAKVAMQPLAVFLQNASGVGYFRLNFPEAIRADVAEKAMQYYRRKTPFDDKFSLYDDKAVYCTELVWASVKSASGYDIAPDKSVLMGRKFIGNDDLYLGGFMTPIAN